MPDVFISRTNERFSVIMEGKLQVVRFVKFKSGGVKLPLIVRSQPRFGAMFRVKDEQRIENDVVWYLGSGQKYMYLPILPEIEHYQFLVRAIGGEWRFLEVSAVELLKSKRLEFTKLKDLPLLQSLAAGKDYLRKYQAGRRKADYISNQER